MTAHPLSALLSANPVSVPVAASLAEVLALMAAGLAALWPAWRLARIPPAALLKVFANER